MPEVGRMKIKVATLTFRWRSQTAVQDRENIYINSEIKYSFTDELAKYQSEGRYSLGIVLHIFSEKSKSPKHGMTRYSKTRPKPSYHAE